MTSPPKAKLASSAHRLRHRAGEHDREPRPKPKGERQAHHVGVRVAIDESEQRKLGDRLDFAGAGMTRLGFQYHSPGP
jgi:hypothetical protein